MCLKQVMGLWFIIVSQIHVVIVPFILMTAKAKNYFKYIYTQDLSNQFTFRAHIKNNKCFKF